MSALVKRISSGASDKLGWTSKRVSLEKAIKGKNKNRSKNINKSNAKVHQIMENAVSLRVFVKFLQLQHCNENLLFWMVAEAYNAILNSNKARKLGVELAHDHVLDHARTIFARYICDDAPRWVCVHPDLVKEIEGKLRERPDEIDSNLFLKAQAEAMQTLVRDCLPRFIKCVLGEDTVTGFDLSEDERVACTAVLESD
mmetsp:Transcript_19539/g.32138  ORF Transcript_19539/g.32138 Transcript_19539/m.32138 type:complete len:199 (+) Transcript_19539:240-836(+)|eukprot:CAMPEP_0203750786 /NCGR_PEP_ID=MMETSP0098-20131031/4955_1 /ASSEMBLY_ACC=CAM_ASM_000208 /TAXON_ID=96639 /ORGANISM=" , Strain NY0313808BC1" /LENGTH=198 /DNA_ID=CAMNT_0050640227 /DNA_START=368 /DNA_END=964 /DNA_ORIENTATION=-